MALGLALLMFFYYRRELRYQAGAARWIPALLRSLAVFLLVLCLSAPVLRHTSVVRQLGRVAVVVDASASMSYADESREAPRPGAPKPATASEPRFQRMEKALLDPANSLIQKLAKQHDVELYALRGYQPERLWWRRNGGEDSSGEIPTKLGVNPDGTTTNLADPLRNLLGPSMSGTALVILTDGQHNGEGSPEDLARELSESKVPVFTVGYGQEAPPADLALLDIAAPEAVFADGRVEGSLLIQDTMPADLPAMASIMSQGKVLWQEALTTTGRGERKIEYSFPVNDLPKSEGGETSLRLLKFRIDLANGSSVKDKIVENNGRGVALHLLSHKRKVLILDGRPRWETRYLRNHFDRDERWEVTAAWDDFSSGLSATVQAAFPKTKDELMTYDLVILGDVRPGVITGPQQDSVREFVEKRGGGIILVDGQRGHLQQWGDTAAAGLMPVSWRKGSAAGSEMAYNLSAEGQGLEALRLSDSRSGNAKLWTSLPKAMWCAPAEARPDATLVASLRGSGQAGNEMPAVVWRRYGAGSVLWLGTDEFWRWRYEVADMHHQRFWMQIATWIAAPPFLVENERLAIGADRLRYEEGGNAELRVRLRSAEGTIITDAQPRAHVFRNGLEVASLQLETDPSHGGVFRAVTGSLPSGDYEVTVTERTLDAAADKEVKLKFRVESHASQEWSQLTLNRPLLESMARSTGGRFLREGDIGQIPDLLQQLDRQETRVRELQVWSSWWCFGAVILLLTLEWIFRKAWRLV